MINARLRSRASSHAPRTQDRQVDLPRFRQFDRGPALERPASGAPGSSRGHPGLDKPRPLACDPAARNRRPRDAEQRRDEDVCSGVPGDTGPRLDAAVDRGSRARARGRRGVGHGAAGTCRRTEELQSRGRSDPRHGPRLSDLRRRQQSRDGDARDAGQGRLQHEALAAGRAHRHAHGRADPFRRRRAVRRPDPGRGPGRAAGRRRHPRQGAGECRRRAHAR